MTDRPAIQFEEIEHKRLNFRLGPVTLDIPKGMITAIVGPNGSGKSTLFRMALGLVKPTKGHIALLGRQGDMGCDERLKRRIGYLPESDSQLDDNWKAHDKAAFHSNWYDSWDANRYREMLRVFQINDEIALGKMSKGMRRKFEFTLAMAHNPELLLLDEPSSGLDPMAWKTMIDMLHRYMDQGDRTVLMSTHIIEEVKRLADYIVFMVQGKVLGVYEKDELFRGWFTFYVSGEGLNGSRLSELPGLSGLDPAGGTTYRATTSKALEAERWLVAEGLDIVSKSPLELDDIMGALMEQHGLGIRVNETRGMRP